MSPITVGFVGLIFLVLFLFSGMPVAFVLITLGFLGFSYLTSVDGGLTLLGTTLFDHFSSYTLTVIPTFIFMGQIAFHGGMSTKLYSTAHTWLGHQAGGLAMATIAACAGFSAICGSSLATAGTMGSVALPEMRKHNYDLKLATGCIAAGGTLGILIPPSVVLIIYGVETRTSIGKLFIAGILPGLLITVLFMITIYVLCLHNRGLGPPGPRTTFKKKVASLPGTVEMLTLFALVMGGLFMGFFTPTEAGAIGAAGAILISLVRGGLTRQGFLAAAWETLRMSCMILLLMAGGAVFSHFLTASTISTKVPILVMDKLSLNPVAILIMIMVAYAIAGCLMDTISFMIITLPIFFPVITALGYDPIWFGVLIVVLMEMGAVTPPVGLNVYTLSSVARDVPMETIFRGIVPFLIAIIVGIIILTLLPQIALLLPSLAA